MSSDPNVELNPWHPVKDPIVLKTLGKLIEELGELQSALARCIIQGVDEVEPITGKLNRIWLMEEIADVVAGIELTEELLSLELETILSRSTKKKARLKEWHRMA